MISICHNNIYVRDNHYKSDYIKQIFILTHNAYFHSEVTVNQERHYRYASFYPITKNNTVSPVDIENYRIEATPVLNGLYFNTMELLDIN
jgi:wobble nucleotide-excising tRNase